MFAKLPIKRTAGVIITLLGIFWKPLNAWSNVDFLFEHWDRVLNVLKSGYLPPAIGLIGLALIAWSIWEQRQGKSKSKDTSERVFIEKTPQQLTKFFRDHTQRQAYKLLDDFAGKWMRLTGEINDVQDLYQGIQIIFYERGLLIFLQFNEEWTDRVSTLARGDHVCVVGEITTITPTHVSLSKCELVEMKRG